MDQQELLNSKLRQAVKDGDFALCERLLQQGADVHSNGGGGGRTALHLVAWKGHADICRLLVQHGAKVSEKDDYNRTSLHVAVANGRIPIVQYFLDECGEDIDQRTAMGKTLDQIDMDGQVEQDMKAFLIVYRKVLKTERAIHDAIPVEEGPNRASRSRGFSPL